MASEYEMLSGKLRNRVAALPFARFPFPARALVKIIEALPEDAVFVRSYENPNTLQWGIVVASKSFKELCEMDEIPQLNAKVTKEADGTIEATITFPVSASTFLEELGKL